MSAGGPGTRGSWPPLEGLLREEPQPGTYTSGAGPADPRSSQPGGWGRAQVSRALERWPSSSGRQQPYVGRGAVRVLRGPRGPALLGLSQAHFPRLRAGPPAGRRRGAAAVCGLGSILPRLCTPALALRAGSVPQLESRSPCWLAGRPPSRSPLSRSRPGATEEPASRGCCGREGV